MTPDLSAYVTDDLVQEVTMKVNLIEDYTSEQLDCVREVIQYTLAILHARGQAAVLPGMLSLLDHAKNGDLILVLKGAGQ